METFSALLALCAGNSLVTGEFPAALIFLRSTPKQPQHHDTKVSDHIPDSNGSNDVCPDTMLIPVHCIYYAPSRILVFLFRLMLAVLCIILNKVYLILIYLLISEISENSLAHLKNFIPRIIESHNSTITVLGRHGVSNHLQLDCLFNNLFRPTSKKTSKLCFSYPLWHHHDRRIFYWNWAERPWFGSVWNVSLKKSLAVMGLTASVVVW